MFYDERGTKCIILSLLKSNKSPDVKLIPFDPARVHLNSHTSSEGKV